MADTRQVVLDTETTGLDPDKGHRVIEIGCVELINGIPTSNVYHQYINPEREVPYDAFQVHGISTEFLLDKPVFSKIYDAFHDFIDGAELIIHNAGFDLKFLNSECNRLRKPTLSDMVVIDTLQIARKKFPGAKANLDALCTRFGIDISNRTKHGALLDAELLAAVYIELTGGVQCDMLASIGQKKKEEKEATLSNQMKKERPYREPRTFAANEDELAAHADFIKKIKEPVWDEYTN